MRKRVLATVLTVLMVVAMIPIGTVKAEESSQQQELDSIKWLPSGAPFHRYDYYGFTYSEEVEDNLEEVCLEYDISKNSTNDFKDLYSTTEYSKYGDEIRINNPLPGQKYYFKTRVYYNEVDYSTGQTVRHYGVESPVISLTIPVPTTTLNSVVNNNGKSLVLKWNKVSGSSGYNIYRGVSNSQTPDVSKVKLNYYKTVGNASNSYVDTGVTFGKTYIYKVIPYVQLPTEKVYAANSNIKYATLTYGAVVGVSTKISSASKAKITWKKHTDSRVKGYRIYRSTEKYGVYKKIKTITSRSKTSYTASKLVNGTTYYFKVCAYGKFGGKTLVGTDSSSKSRLMNVYGYELEPWELKSKRIYGSKGKRKYPLNKKAKKYMTTITIKVWDYKSGKKGKKVTRVKYLQVNKYLAKTYKQIFKEIYKGKEKFPIKDIGCYSPRVGEHSLGCAVDINPWENYMIDGKKVMAGKFWKPKKNPYSIPKNGDVVKVMRKYGFYRGLWGNRRDYMHFSYFGT